MGNSLKDFQVKRKRQIEEAAQVVFGKDFEISSDGWSIYVGNSITSQLVRLSTILDITSEMEEPTIEGTRDPSTDVLGIEICFPQIRAPKKTEILLCINGKDNLEAAKNLQYKYYEYTDQEIYLTATGEWFCHAGDITDY